MPEFDLDRRRAAAELFGDGVSRAETARRLGLSRATATRWYRRWRAGGVQALCATPAAGRPPKLSEAALRSAQAALSRPPCESGFALEHWSLAAVAAHIERTTGVAYHPRHVARVLRRAGWVILPVGEFAPLAFRQVEQRDPDGNPLWLRPAGSEAGRDPRSRG